MVVGNVIRTMVIEEAVTMYYIVDLLMESKIVFENAEEILKVVVLLSYIVD